MYSAGLKPDKQVVHRVRVSEGVVDVTCGQDHSVLVTETGRLYSCGWGADGQTGLSHYNNQADQDKKCWP